MNTYFDTNEKKDCNGCGACALKCPKNAITMEMDTEGFLYPVINKEKCINCGLCKKICSNIVDDTKNESESYLAINKDKDILNKSTSGGIFSVLSNYILNKNGVIYGVKFDENINVIHGCAKNKEELEQFRHVKYVRSDLKNSYYEIEEYLKQGIFVLFTGTPCQCAGLRNYLMKDYDNLITCEILCHANPSPKIFDMYKKSIENEYNSKIKSIVFRDKSKFGWHSGHNTIVTLENGKEINKQEYTHAFLRELINRPSCHSCKFSSTKRYSDFTIGDFWGIDKIDSSIKDDNTGISLLCVNTNKGKSILEEIKEDMTLKNYDIEESFKYNHNGNVLPNKNREAFFEGIKNGSINENNVNEHMKKYTKDSIYKRAYWKIKNVIKK